MKTCYVSAPFGLRRVPHPSGHTVEVNFDRIYREVIAPAVAEAGLDCVRADEFEGGGVAFKSIFDFVLGSEVMIADISSNSPNVLYELGARHALRRDVTIIIKSAGGRVPHHMNYNRLFTYDIDDRGGMDIKSAERFRAMLAAAIRAGVERVTNDSPIYELFPDIHVELPDELYGERERKTYPRFTKKGGPGHKVATEAPRTTAAEADEAEARESERAVRETENVDPHAHVEVLKKYRAASNWNELVRYADELLDEIRNAPEVMQLVALALNRRDDPGDQDRAIDLMKKYIAETGGDGESYGILGRIYRDRFYKCREAGQKEQAAADFAEAVKHYRDGFEKQPSEYYLGLGLVMLLIHRRDEEGRRELGEILPRVRQVVGEKVQGRLVNFWELATAVDLAAAAGDWDEAHALVEKALDTAPAAWMIDAATRNLQTIAESLGESPESERVAEIVGHLRRAQPSEEGQNA